MDLLDPHSLRAIPWKTCLEGVEDSRAVVERLQKRARKNGQLWFASGSSMVRRPAPAS